MGLRRLGLRMFNGGGSGFRFRFDLTRFDLTRFDLTWFDLTWFDLTWFDLTWFDLTWFDLARFDLARFGRGSGWVVNRRRARRMLRGCRWVVMLRSLGGMEGWFGSVAILRLGRVDPSGIRFGRRMI